MSKPNVAFAAASATLALLIPLSGCGSGDGTSSIAPNVTLPTPTPSTSASATPTATPSPTATPTPSPTPSGPVTATGQFQDLIFTLTTPKRTYAVGEMVPLTFTVQNTGGKEVTFSSTSPYFAAAEVTDANGGYVSLFDNRTESRSRLTVIHTLVVPAGQTQTFSMEWGTQSNNTMPFDQTAPGNYSIRGYLFAYDANGESHNHADFETAPLTITVQ